MQPEIDFTQAAPNVQTAPTFVVAPVNHTAMAQLVAGEDYDAVLALTHDGPLAADAYHIAYQRYVRDHLAQGAGPLCGCDLCRREIDRTMTFMQAEAGDMDLVAAEGGAL